MGLKRSYLVKAAQILVLITGSILLPGYPAQAAVTFSSSSSVNQNALSVLAPYEMQASADGSIVVAATYGYLLKSTDSGTTWNPISNAGVKNWSAVAINDSGTVIVAAEYGGNIWLSTNSGASFSISNTGISATANWYWLDTNASGSVIVASYLSTSIYISTNTGTSWSPKTISGTSSIKQVSISAIGDRMILFSSANNTLFTSTDTGANWTPQNGGGSVSSNGSSFFLSRDGQRILFMRSSAAYLSKSIDFGVTWETITVAINNVLALYASDDLSKIWFGGSGGSSYYSTNSGASWSNSVTSGVWKLMYINPSATRWISFFGNNGIWTSDGVPGTMTYRALNLGVSTWAKSAVSYDGTTMAVATSYGEVSTSQNAGATWSGVNNLGRSTWSCLAVSGDGNVVYVGGGTSRLWKSIDRGVTFESLTGTNLPTTGTSIAGCSTNSDGTKFAVSLYGNGIYYSSNGAGSLSQVWSRTYCATYVDFGFVTMTADGSKLATACAANGNSVFTSSNSGSSWETRTLTSSGNFRDIKSSSDGSVLVVSFSSTLAPQISRNWGGSWASLPSIGSSFLSGLSVSADGSMIIAGQYSPSGSLYYSSNRGTSFSAVPAVLTGYYPTVAVSGDGSKLIYGVDGRFLNLMSISNVASVASFTSLNLSAAAKFRSQITITATLSTAGTDGKITFFAAGKPIAGCIKVTTSSLVATCSWKASSRGSVTLSATSYPTDTGYISGSTSVPVIVANRTGLRG